MSRPIESLTTPQLQNLLHLVGPAQQEKIRELIRTRDAGTQGEPATSALPAPALAGAARQAPVQERKDPTDRRERDAKRAARAALREAERTLPTADMAARAAAREIRFAHLPVSKNALRHATVRNGVACMILSREAKAWMRYAADVASQQWGLPMLGGPVELTLRVVMDQDRLLSAAQAGVQGFAEGLRGSNIDLQNFPEIVADSLEGIAYVNDRQACRIVLEKRYVPGIGAGGEHAVVAVRPVDPDAYGWIAPPPLVDRTGKRRTTHATNNGGGAGV